MRAEQPFRLHAAIGLDHSHPEPALFLVADEPLQGGVQRVLEAVVQAKFPDLELEIMALRRGGAVYNIPKKSENPGQHASAPRLFLTLLRLKFKQMFSMLSHSAACRRRSNQRRLP
jgi:hypothetical protein